MFQSCPDDCATQLVGCRLAAVCDEPIGDACGRSANEQMEPWHSGASGGEDRNDSAVETGGAIRSEMSTDPRATAAGVTMTTILAVVTVPVGTKRR